MKTLFAKTTDVKNVSFFNANTCT